MNFSNAQFDVVIIGGGPAGMSAVLWCDDLGLNSCLIECDPQLGGQLHRIHNSILNHLGTEFDDGQDCFEQFSKSLKERRFESLTGSVDSIDTARFEVKLSSGATIVGKAIVIATGVRRRKLGVPGEVEYFGKGILESGAKFRSQAEGRRVAVIGGGDAALENALILAEHADRVFLIHRRNEFTAKHEFLDSVRSNKKIEIVTEAVVQRFGGSDMLGFIDVRGIEGSISRMTVDNAVVRIGVEPNNNFISPPITVDRNGYLQVDREGRTTADLIYAVGDVANPVSPTISSAVGTAATAIKSIANLIRKNE